MLRTLLWLAALWLGCTFAFEFRSFHVNDNHRFERTPLVLRDLVVNGRYRFESYNSPYLFVTNNYFNKGHVFLDSDAAFGSNAHIEYSFDGRFTNHGEFVVRHNNPTLPLNVFISARSYASRSLSNNDHMVFLVNSAAMLDMTVTIAPTWCFFNVGWIMMLGTPQFKPRLELKDNQFPETVDGVAVGMRFANKGVIFLKNAELHQNLNVTYSGGCIIIDEGGNFIANTAHRVKGQIFYFANNAEQATLTIKSAHTREDGLFFVRNFSHNARIVVDSYLKQFFITLSGNVILFPDFKDPVQGPRLTFIFRTKMKEADFHFENGVLTYHGQILLRYVPHCKAESDIAQKVAAQHEIHA